MKKRQTHNSNGELPLLGFGCMRFPRKGRSIDQSATNALLQRALDNGVDYFDTAYLYGGSEEALGKFITLTGQRDKMKIATKIPHYMCKSSADFDKYFDTSLKRLQTDYIDYYLIHMLTSLSSWERAVGLGMGEWLDSLKRDGRARRIGFSYHGGREDFPKLLDAYPWDFVQIQLNYLDANSQAGMAGLHAAAERGIPVIIMEPLRGGRLANQLPSSAERVFRAFDSKRTPAQWAFKWLYDLPEVSCVLSGMSSLKMLDENIALASECEPNCISLEERAVYEDVIEVFRHDEVVPCTGCGYCLPCPTGVDIPDCFRALNVKSSEGYMAGMQNYIMNTTLKAETSNASRCIKCGKCEEHCPQSIAIRDELDVVRKELEGIPYKLVSRFKGIVFKS